MFKSNLLSVILVVCLAGMVQAVSLVSEDFNSGFGSEQPISNGDPAWSSGSSTEPIRSQNAEGYDGTAGIRINTGVPWRPVGDHYDGVPSGIGNSAIAFTTAQSGTVTAKGLFNMAALNNSLSGGMTNLGEIALGISLSEGGAFGSDNADNWLEAQVLGDWDNGNTGVNLASKIGGTPAETRPTIGSAAQDMGWFEFSLIYDLDANSASVVIQDIAETGGAAVGAPITLAFGSAPTFNPSHFGIRISNCCTSSSSAGHTGALNPGGLMDNLSVIHTAAVPEPATVGLLVTGGMLMLRRRNR